ncbi:MAG: hypothetical protein ACP5US_11335, partial [Candidatus Kryptoniota bacterium]
MEIEKNIFKEKVDFLQLLTNAAFNPEEAGVTKVTQVMALSISQPWIIEAFDSYVAQYRSKIPSVVELSIDGFTTQTKDGNDVDEQLLRQDRYYRIRLERDLEEIDFPTGPVVLGGAITLAGLWLITGVSMLIGGIAVGIAAIIIGLNLYDY